MFYCFVLKYDIDDNIAVTSRELACTEGRTVLRVTRLHAAQHATVQVFGNPSNMARLQGIVWPEIRLLVQQKIDGLAREGAESVVLEAAVLLEAGWDDMCDELWVVQVPPAVAR